jgi:hypothetical protein
MSDMERPDPKVERSISSWLHDEPDSVPESLADDALMRSQSTGQRSTWAARWHQRGGPAVPERLVMGAPVVAALAVIAVVVGLSVWRTPAEVGTNAPARIDLEEPATSLGSGFGSLWVGDDEGRLLRINPGDGSVQATIELDGVPCGPISPAGSSLWLATCGVGGSTSRAETTRVDPATNTLANVYGEGGGDGFGASAMNGLVWFISDFEQGTITAVNADTGEHVRDLTLGERVRHMTAGFGSLWVSPIGRPVVQRVNPESGEVVAEITLSGDAGYLTTGTDAIWVAEPHQWLVARIDPVADRVVAELQAAPDVDHISIAPDGLVWALADELLLAINPASNQEADRATVPSHRAFDGVTTHVLALDGDNVWFADKTSLERIRSGD